MGTIPTVALRDQTSQSSSLQVDGSSPGLEGLLGDSGEKGVCRPAPRNHEQRLEHIMRRAVREEQVWNGQPRGRDQGAFGGGAGAVMRQGQGIFRGRAKMSLGLGLSHRRSLAEGGALKDQLPTLSVTRVLLGPEFPVWAEEWLYWLFLVGTWWGADGSEG